MKRNEAIIFCNPFGLIFLMIYGIMWVVIKIIYTIYLAVQKAKEHEEQQ